MMLKKNKVTVIYGAGGAIGRDIARAFLILTGMFFLPIAIPAQAPSDLRAAIAARDESFFKADTTNWGRLTTHDFTMVDDKGNLWTRAQRIAAMVATTPSSRAALENEQFTQHGNTVIRQFVADDRRRNLQVWVKDAKGWRVGHSGHSHHEIAPPGS